MSKGATAVLLAFILLARLFPYGACIGYIGKFKGAGRERGRERGRAGAVDVRDEDEAAGGQGKPLMSGGKAEAGALVAPEAPMRAAPARARPPSDAIETASTRSYPQAARRIDSRYFHTLFST